MRRWAAWAQLERWSWVVCSGLPAQAWSIPLPSLASWSVALHSHGLLGQRLLWTTKTWTPGIAGLAGTGCEMLASTWPDGPGVSAGTVNKFCERGHACEAVEALGALVQSGCLVSQSLIYAVLRNCVGKRELVLGRRVHALAVQQGYGSDTFLCNHILRMYAFLGMLEEAMHVFSVVAEPDVFMWSSMISAHVKHGQGEQGIALYRQMRRSGMEPDGHVYVAALQACGREADLRTGRQVHVDVMACGVEPDLFVVNCLVDMYAKCGRLDDAKRVLDGLGRKDAVSWNAMIAGYAQQGRGEEALHLYRTMKDEGVAAPTSVTYVSLLQACASVGAGGLEAGKELHAQIDAEGLLADAVVGCSLVNMYAKCGSIEDARGVFARLERKTLVTWNAMMAGYCQQGMGQEALLVYQAMRNEGISAPDSTTFACLLQGCADVAALHPGRWLHVQIEEHGHHEDPFVVISLINMYAKSGSMVDAQQVFDGLPEPDSVAWNALIAGYTRQGDSETVFQLHCRMQEQSVLPDSVTFLSVLKVCSHAGLVDKGREYFEAMSQHYGITPTTDHYTCMVDILGRAGLLHEALRVARSMPVPPDTAVWHTLLGACQKWSNVEVGLHSFKEALKLHDKDAAAYVLMSNIYRRAQMWEEAQKLQRRRKAIGAWKQPGQSWWVGIDGLVHVFVVRELTPSAR